MAGKVFIEAAPDLLGHGRSGAFLQSRGALGEIVGEQYLEWDHIGHDAPYIVMGLSIG